MQIIIEVWFDYTSPECFLAGVHLDRLRKEEPGVEVRWRSFELRPPGAPEMPASTRAQTAGDYQRARQTAREECGIALNPGPIGIRTRLAHIASHYAESLGKGGAFHAAVMQAYWLQAKSIADVTALRNLGAQSGVTLEKLGNHWEKTEFAAAVDADLQLGRAQGITAVPALLFAGTLLISGAVPPEALKVMVAKARKETRSQAARAKRVRAMTPAKPPAIQN